MVATALVTEPQRSAAVFLQHLEESGLPIEAAFWLLAPESDIWYLYVASPVVAKQGSRPAYERARAALEETAVNIPLAQVKMVSPSASLVRNLRTAMRVEGWSWIVFRRNTVNGVFIHDAVILRL